MCPVQQIPKTPLYQFVDDQTPFYDPELNQPDFIKLATQLFHVIRIAKYELKGTEDGLQRTLNHAIKATHKLAFVKQLVSHLTQLHDLYYSVDIVNQSQVHQEAYQQVCSTLIDILQYLRTLISNYVHAVPASRFDVSWGSMERDLNRKSKIFMLELVQLEIRYNDWQNDLRKYLTLYVLCQM
jgi:hypothetical protein